MPMQPYANTSGSSPIESFEIDTENLTINVRFRGSRRRKALTYRYTEASAGGDVVTSMIELALTGSGLATFIAREGPSYASKS